MGKFRILLIHNSYKKTFIGGEDLVFINEVESLKKLLGEKFVYTYVRSNDNANFLNVITSIFFSFKSFFEILKIIKQNEIDIIHVHNFFPLISMSVFLAAKVKGIKSVLTLHNFRPWCIAGTFYRDDIGVCKKCAKKVIPVEGIFNRCFRKSYLQSTLAQIAFVFYKFIGAFDWVDKYFVLSQFQENIIYDLGVDKNKILLKPNLVTKSEATGNGDRSGYVFVGRPERGKGLELLLQNWEKLDGSFHLKIIGEMSGANHFIEKYGDFNNIEFMGKLDNKEVKKVLASSKYLIHPALYYETFGLTIVEAFSVGTPVIGLDIGTRKELIKDHSNGFLSPRENLLTTIKKSKSYNDYSSLMANAKKTYEVYKEEYITEIAINHYKRILEDK